MNIELISVGTEILLGDILNTNVSFLSRELASIGINVYRHTTVGDNKKRLLKSLENAFENSDTVIITGGLGPTDDDITKECAGEFFKRDFFFDKYSFEKIKNYVDNCKNDNSLPKNNKKQAMIPENSIILENLWGTAPGIILKKENKKIILLPGPPKEMKNMFEKYVKPFLKKQSNKKFISKYIRLYGIYESTLEEKIKHILIKQTNPTVALYAKSTEVLIRVTASGTNNVTINNLIENKIKEIKDIVGDYVYLIGDESVANTQSELSSVVAKMLINNSLTISTAESITGGMIASSLIDNEGISKSFIEGIVCYSNESKMNNLNVKLSTLDKYTAVSKEVALEMLTGIKNKTKTDISIITTGYASKIKNSEINVGLVYIGIYYKNNKIIKKYELKGNRNKIREKVTKEALNQIRKLILDDYKK